MAFSFLLVCGLMEKIVIIGGGVAGLSCLNALIDQGLSPLLLEEKTIGLPKVCGEFLAPLACSQLQKWGIGPIQRISKVCFLVNNRQTNLTFPNPAGAFSRTEAELGLAKRAHDRGGRILEKIRIKKINPSITHSPYVIDLESGEQILAQTLIIASGKLNPSASLMEFPYQGFKIHVPQVLQAETLFMSHYPGAYFGLVPINSEISNLTCLVQRKVVEQWGSCKTFFQHLIKVSPLLKEIEINSIQWLEGKAPEFKAQVVPDWKNAFWIGDALASFYPAIGYGFAHSVNSAMIAAHFYLHGDVPLYNKFIQKEIKHKLWIGKLLHHSFMHQTISGFLLSITRTNPGFAEFLMKKAGFS